MADVQTWGVDQTFVAAMAPTILVSDDTGSLVTTARLATMTDVAAALVNGFITGIWGEDAVASFVAGATTSNQGASVYAQIQGLVWMRLEPMLYSAAHGRIAVADEIRDLEITIENKVRNLKAAPQDLGDTSISEHGSQAQTSTAYLGVDTTSTPEYLDGWEVSSTGRRSKNW